jgi:putative endonuclease
MSSTTRVLYIGVTNNVIKRVEEHKNEINDGFTKKYQTKKLVYYEYFTDIVQAIKREKELKGWSRKKKITLIQDQNSGWKDLYSGITG